MKIQTQIHGTVTVIRPHGPLIAEELVDLRRAVENTATSKPSHLILDMGDIPSVDSSGIELLLEICGVGVGSAPRPAGAAPRWLPKRVKLAALTDTCREALDLTNVLPRLDVIDTVENALRSCSSGFRATAPPHRTGAKSPGAPRVAKPALVAAPPVAPAAPAPAAEAPARPVRDLKAES